MIQKAQISDVRRVTEFMKQFEQASKYVKVDVEHSIAQYEKLIGLDIAVMLMLLGENNELQGGLGALKVPDLHCGIMTGIETFWFVAPEFRGKGITLFNAFEHWAVVESGCKRTAMIHLEDSYPKVLKKLYERRGYYLMESHYVKDWS